MTADAETGAPAGTDPQTDYRLRTVRVGIILTVLVVGGLALWPLAPDVSLPQVRWYYLLLLVAILGAVFVALLPWPALFARGWGIPAMYAWSVADIAIITGLVAVTGGAGSPIFLVYVFTTVFFAASYPIGGQVALAGFTGAAYTGVTVLEAGASPSTVALRLLMLGLITYMAGFLSRELLHVTEVAARRGRLLGQVATASRQLHQLDHDVVLRQTVDAVCMLGWDAAALELVDDANPRRSVVQHSKGLPPAYSGAQPIDQGLMGLVSSSSEPVVITDYPDLAGANPDVTDAGIRTGVGVPVFVQGRFAGALFAATVEERSVEPIEVEALELLAATVSLAMENAAAYTSQQQASERLAELDEAKTEFIVTASHELRTPMTIAHGMALTLRQRWDDLDEQTREMLLGRLEAGMEQLGHIVETLIEYAHVSATATAGSETVSPVGPAVRAAVSQVAAGAPDRRVLTDIEDADVRADSSVLSRVVGHLLVNALAHTPASSAARVTVHRDTTAHLVRFTVTDEGPGMTPEQLEEAEGQFVRGGDVDERSSGGLGLGLPLVRRLLAVYGADLHLESSPDTGTTATFALPLAEAVVLTDEPDQAATRA